MAKLYIVSTPIGNLGDITQRALETLGAVQRVLAEDTRRTSILFRHYGITTPLYSAHAHNEQGRAAQLLTWLDDGENVALVSDAGTPLLSDPGARIVHVVLEKGHEVVPVPGASALLAALVGSGLAPEPFTYFGFPPRSGRGRTELFEEISKLSHTAVLYEAPGRLLKLITDLASVCGADRPVVVARELTKLYETFVRGTMAEVAAYYEDATIKGEVVVLVGAALAPAPEDAEARAHDLAEALLGEGKSKRDTAKEVARATGLNKNRAYEIVLSLAGQGDEAE
jgi:16S rRNA (cytidine1402-2'-O)-methyltransferase